MFEYLLGMNGFGTSYPLLLHKAADSPSKCILNHIIERGIHVNLSHTHEDDPHEHVIHTAAQDGRLNNVIILLEKHASIDASNERGSNGVSFRLQGRQGGSCRGSSES